MRIGVIGDCAWRVIRTPAYRDALSIPQLMQLFMLVIAAGSIGPLLTEQRRRFRGNHNLSSISGPNQWGKGEVSLENGGQALRHGNLLEQTPRC